MHLRKHLRATLEQCRLMIQELNEIASLYMVPTSITLDDETHKSDPSSSFRRMQTSLLNDFEDCGTNATDDAAYLEQTYHTISAKLQEARATYLAHFKELHHASQQEYIAQKFSEYYQRLNAINTPAAKQIVRQMHSSCRKLITLEQLNNDLPSVKEHFNTAKKHLAQKVEHSPGSLNCLYIAYLQKQLHAAESALKSHKQKIARLSGALVLPCLTMSRFLNEYAIHNKQLVANLQPAA